MDTLVHIRKAPFAHLLQPLKVSDHDRSICR